MSTRFLTLPEILEIHEDRIRVYGGISGVRSLDLLQSAIGNVEATFGGEYLHQSLFEMAAAYLYGICRNHPFLDGNKRTALACALAFLRFNDLKVSAPPDSLYDLVIGVAEGRVSKDAVAVFFEGHSSSSASRPL
jgi:death on curing protein